MVSLGTHQSYSLLCFRHIFTSLFIFFFFFSLFCYFSGSSHSLLLVIYLLITPFNLGFHLLTLSPPSFYVFIYFEIYYYLFKYARHLRTKPNKQASHRCTLKLVSLSLSMTTSTFFLKRLVAKILAILNMSIPWQQVIMPDFTSWMQLPDPNVITGVPSGGGISCDCMERFLVQVLLTLSFWLRKDFCAAATGFSMAFGCLVQAHHLVDLLKVLEFPFPKIR